MIVLGIETATDRAGVALGGPDGLMAAVEVGGGRRHAETVSPAIEQVCHHAGIRLRDVNAVAVDVGPGLFTGMRVGIAAAKALAFALGIPAIPVVSLDVVAFPLRFATRRVASVIDARKGQVFYALYAPVPGGVQRLGEVHVSSVDDLVADLRSSGEHHLLVGSGAWRYRDELAAAERVEFADRYLDEPSVSALVYLAGLRAARREYTDGAALEPVYLRAPDAKIHWETHRGTR